MVRAGHLARSEARAATHDGGVRGRVVRRSERRSADEGAHRALTGDRGNDRRRERFRVAERRKEPRDRPGQERLAAARRAHQEQRVAAGKRNLQGPTRLRLAAHLGEVRDRARWRGVGLLPDRGIFDPARGVPWIRRELDSFGQDGSAPAP